MRFIQVGTGGFGNIWLNTLMNNSRARFAALVDMDEKNLETARKHTGCPKEICFASLSDALQSVEADAVVCVTPPSAHRRIIVPSLKAGLDVISEKPMAETMTDCRVIQKTVRETGRTCVISQNYRYKPEMYTLIDGVRKGRIGEIGQVTVNFMFGHDFHGGFRHEIAYPLIVDMAVHHFDLIRAVTGLDAVFVRGEAWNPPWSNYKGDGSSSVVFTMNNGARVVYTGSWCSKGKHGDWNANWHIEGERGTLLYENGHITLCKTRGYDIMEQRAVPVKKMKHTNQAYVLNEFMKAVKAGRRPETDVEDNMKSVGMVFAAVQAMKTGKRIALAQ